MARGITDPKSHVDKIRRENGLENGQPQGRNIAALENALKISSEQLYEKATHFLLELIQNADDNSYDPTIVTPTLSLTYDYSGLRVDCNGLGFLADNVDALCAIGQSTRFGLDHSTRYIDEEGIGFEVRFKAADVMWISSRGYTFRLDKNEQISMVTPIWARFPRKAWSKWTSFYIQFSAGSDTLPFVEARGEMAARSSFTTIGKFTNMPETMGKYLDETVKMISSLDLCRGGSRPELEWRAPIADAQFPQVIVSTALEMKSSYKALRRLFATKSPTNVPQTDPIPSESSNSTKSLPALLRAQNDIKSLHTNLIGWRFITTRKGYVEIVSGYVQVGDSISIFSSGGGLFLLRRNISTENGWRHVGECYVHGIMVGEVFKVKATSTILSALRACRSRRK